MTSLPDAPDIPAGEPVERLQSTLHRMLKALVFRDAPPSLLTELPMSQLRCLRTIGDHEGEKMVDLAHRLEIKLPAMSQIVDRLVRRGMVERQADPHDRRVVRLILTPAARAIHQEVQTARQARMAATAANLDSDALARVVEGLSLLAAAAEKVQQEEGTGALPAAAPVESNRGLPARRRRRPPDVSPAGP